MQCHHTDADDLPEFLCRQCHPELNRTATERAALNRADTKARTKRLKQEAKAREVRQAEMKLASLLMRGEPAEGSVSAKIAASVRRKLKRLAA